MGYEVATWNWPTYLLLDLESRLIAQVTGINCTRHSQVLVMSASYECQTLRKGLDMRLLGPTEAQN